jgi:hypothetical protein
LAPRRFKMRWKALRSRILSLISVSSGMVFRHSAKLAAIGLPDGGFLRVRSSVSIADEANFYLNETLWAARI